MKKGLSINDTIHGLIPLTDYEKRIISTAGFNRLHDVYQNSTVYLTFPTNRTKRFEHSIGTMKLCSDMFYQSILNAKDDTLSNFYNIFKSEIIKIIEEIHNNASLCELKLDSESPDVNSIPSIILDNFMHSLIPHKVPPNDVDIHVILFQSIRAAALLHDVGHPPFSHKIEAALGSVYEEVKKDDVDNKYSSEKRSEFLTAMGNCPISNQKLHEQMGNKISDSILREVIPKIERKRNFRQSVEYKRNLFELIVRECVLKIYENKSSFIDLHSIIDNSLDADRLDYVTRDSLSSGLNTGSVDYQRIISNMRLIESIDEQSLKSATTSGHSASEAQSAKGVRKKNMKDRDSSTSLSKEGVRRFYFCFPIKSICNVEDFLLRRFNIYNNIVFHHRVIRTDCLLEYTVRDLIKIYLAEKNSKESEQADFVDHKQGTTREEEKAKEVIENREHFLIPFDVSGLWAPLDIGTTTEIARTLSQWNDAWLLTLLRQIYYSKYYGNESSETALDKRVLCQRLSELLLNRKCYFSLIKRSENFRRIDEAARKTFQRKKTVDEINEMIESLKKSSLPDEHSNVTITTINATLRVIQELLNWGIPGKTDNPRQGFFLWHLYKNRSALIFSDFQNMVEDIVKDKAAQFFRDAEDYFVEFQQNKIGLEESIVFYDNVDNLVPLKDISGIESILQLYLNCQPLFYVYILHQNGEQVINNDRDTFLDTIGEQIGVRIAEKIKIVLRGYL